MTHSELYNRFKSIQTSKNSLRTEMTNYIICTLKSNGNHIESIQGTIRTDHLDEDFPFVINIADKKMHLMGITLFKDKEVMVKVCDAESCKTHSLLLETDLMENLEMTSAFINHTLIEIGERNLYKLLVVYSCNNSRKLFPSSFKEMNDAEAWEKLNGLKQHEVKVFQMKGPKQMFRGFDSFVEQMNEDGLNGCYAIQLHLKEKYL